MASIRGIKNEIDYLVSEVISDGYMALYFNVEKRDAIVSVIEEAVAMRNNLYEKVNNPADKQNKSLVRKHYAQIRRDMISGTDDLFRKLSDICKYFCFIYGETTGAGAIIAPAPVVLLSNDSKYYARLTFNPRALRVRYAEPCRVKRSGWDSRSCAIARV